MSSSATLSDGGPAPRLSCEVHIESSPGFAVLQALSWSHRVQGRQSTVRIRGSAAALARFLQSVTASGLTIDRITRLDPVDPQRASPDDGGAARSTTE